MLQRLASANRMACLHIKILGRSNSQHSLKNAELSGTPRFYALTPSGSQVGYIVRGGVRPPPRRFRNQLPLRPRQELLQGQLGFHQYFLPLRLLPQFQPPKLGLDTSLAQQY